MKTIHHQFAAATALLLLAAFCFEASCEDAPKTVELDLGAGVKLELARIPKGSFKQGSPQSEAGRNADEMQRDVKISRDFLMGKYPVTVGQFARFVAETNLVTEAERGPSGGFGVENGALVQKKEYTWRNPGFKQTDAHPVVMITHAEALAFCAWLAKKSGRKIGMPTEAQWEYACRAGSVTRFYNGDDDNKLNEIGIHKGNADGTTHPVGQMKPNAFGLFDMSGNVYEWCLDWYGEYALGGQTDPVAESPGANEIPRRVLRGGSFLKAAKNCRSAARYRNDPKSRNADNGFRITAAVIDVEKDGTIK